MLSIKIIILPFNEPYNRCYRLNAISPNITYLQRQKEKKGVVRNRQRAVVVAKRVIRETYIVHTNNVCSSFETT